MKRKVKSTLKKVMAALLAAMMLLMVTACSDAGSGTQTTGEKKKIGMLWYGNTDAMGGTFYAWANHAAEVLDV